MKTISTCVVICICLIFLSGCHGYKPKHSLKLTPDEQKVASLSAQLLNDADALDQKARNVPALTDLSDAADEFDHNVGRFGPNSLEARSSFDRVRFHATQAEKAVGERNEKDLVSDLEKVQAQIKEIGRMLGYKDAL